MPPLAVIDKLVPAQISEFNGKTVITGLGITVTTTASVDEQILLASDTVNVYVVVDVGEAIGFGME